MAADVLLRSVLITDIEYLAPNEQWRTCKARDKDALPDEEGTISIVWNDDDGYGIPIVDNTNPQPPNDTEKRDINFNNFMLNTIYGNKNYTLFHPKEGGLGAYESRKTTMIRYKTVCVIVDSGTEFSTKSIDYYYAMIKTSFDVANTLISGSPENSYTSSFEATLQFRFPGFTSSQLGTTAFNSLKSILNDTTNWEIILTKQGPGTSTKHAPTSLTLGNPTEAGSFTGFGMAFIPITLRVPFTGVSSGTYTLSAQFKKNDEGDVDSKLPIPAEFTVTVQLTLGTAIPTQQVIITNDGEVQISVAIQTGSGS
jgi:hypothetical protein